MSNSTSSMLGIFPPIALSKSLEYLSSLINFTVDAQFSRFELLKSMGFSESSGRGSMAISSLRQFGLIDYSAKHYSLTSLAHDLLNTDSYERTYKLRLAAFKTPKVFNELFSIHHHALLGSRDIAEITVLGVKPDQVGRFIEVYNDSLVFIPKFEAFASTVSPSQNAFQAIKEAFSPDRSLAVIPEQPETSQEGNTTLDLLEDTWEEHKIQAYLSRNFSTMFPSFQVYGREFETDDGRVDFLAKNKESNSWLLVEIKSRPTPASAIGQLLFNMSAIRNRLAHNNETVRGVLVVGEGADIATLQGMAKLTSDVEIKSFKFDYYIRIT